MITKRKILKCQNLLHKDYQGVQILIYRSRLLFTIREFLKGRPLGDISNFLFKRSRGWYDPISKIVHLPLFSFKKNSFISVEVVHVLYHELRHYYQFSHKPKLTKKRDWNLLVTDSGYSADPTERDADRFAARMCNKYKDEISEILKVDTDWSVNGYP